MLREKATSWEGLQGIKGGMEHRMPLGKLRSLKKIVTHHHGLVETLQIHHLKRCGLMLLADP